MPYYGYRICPRCKKHMASPSHLEPDTKSVCKRCNIVIPNENCIPATRKQFLAQCA